MKIGVVTLAACLSSALALTVAGPTAFAEKKPPKAQPKEHKTKPGDRYQPRMDVMPGEKSSESSESVEGPGGPNDEGPPPEGAPEEPEERAPADGEAGPARMPTSEDLVGGTLGNTPSP